MLISGVPALVLAGLSHGANRPPEKKVIVVGAGLAGLTAAWTLERYGYAVRVIEAQARIGGRNWTLRHGDTVPDVDGSVQICSFSQGQCFDAGPWRIMPWHHRMLALAQAFHINLLPWHTEKPAAGFYAAGGMDAFVQGIAASLRNTVTTQCHVHSVVHDGPKAGANFRVEWVGPGGDGSEHAHAVVIAVPLNRLSKLQLPKPVHRAIGQVEAADAIKLAFETTILREVSIDEALSLTEGLRIVWPAPIEYPTQNIVTVYANRQTPQGLLRAPRDQQIAMATELLRKQLQQSPLDLQNPLVVQWERIPHQCAAAARLASGQAARIQQLKTAYAPVFFAGDSLSTLNGWQEGAVESGQEAAEAVRHYLGG